MPSVFRPCGPSDAEELASFLKPILAPAVGTLGFDVGDLSWKYWSRRDDWDGSRSYLLEGNGGIEAHCGLVPTWLRCPRGRLRAAHFVDWAADSRTLVAGGRLLRRMMGLSGILCTVGGSAATRKILPLMGFRSANEVVFCARPVRPLLQAATHQRRGWKLLPRLFRNAIWARLARIRTPGGWSFESTSPEHVPAELWCTPTSEWAARERSAHTYGYYLTCPFVRFELFLIHHQNRPAGCFLISFVRGQARVADLWLLHDSPDGYEAAYQLALAAALTDPSVAEVIAAGSNPSRLHALQRCGFREFRRESIMASSTDDLPPQGIDFQLVDNDGAFLSCGTAEYMT